MSITSLYFIYILTWEIIFFVYPVYSVGLEYSKIFASHHHLLFQLIVETLHERIGFDALALYGLLFWADPLLRRLTCVSAAVVGATSLAGTAAIIVGEAALLTSRAHLRCLDVKIWLWKGNQATCICWSNNNYNYKVANINSTLPKSIVELLLMHLVLKNGAFLASFFV